MPRTTVPVGTKAQSVPGPDEDAQTFETVEPIEGRVAWNALRPRQFVRHPLPYKTNHLYFDGLSTTTLGSSFTQVVFRFDLTPVLLLKGVLLAIVIGFVGGVFPAWQAAWVGYRLVHGNTLARIGAPRDHRSHPVDLDNPFIVGPGTGVGRDRLPPCDGPIPASTRPRSRTT